MLARTFLRLCAIEALRPHALIAADAGWPTLAGKHVYDSMLDPIDDLDPAMRRPVAVVYTEHDNLDPIAQHGPGFYAATTDIAFEISVIAADNTAGQYVAGLAYTDAQLEADLDLLEDQIFYCLHKGPTGALFRRMAKLPLADWRSAPHRSAEEGFRLAMRTVTARVHVLESCHQTLPSAALTGFDRLPRPLKEIAQAFDPAGYAGKIAAAIAAGSPVSPVRTPLKTAALNFDVAPPSGGGAPAAIDIAASAAKLDE